MRLKVRTWKTTVTKGVVRAIKYNVYVHRPFQTTLIGKWHEKMVLPFTISFDMTNKGYSYQGMYVRIEAMRCLCLPHRDQRVMCMYAANLRYY